MKRQTKQPNGYILHETQNVAIIATGLKGSENAKTGSMVQIWIIPRNVEPHKAVKSGADSIVCFDCKHRPTLAKKTGDAPCYVTTFQAPLSIHRAYHRGTYSHLSVSRYPEVFSGRVVRFGAWGEPVLLPVSKFRAIVAVCAGHTGYTHQWTKPRFAAYREFLMASVDTVSEANEARANGWRYFRIREWSEAYKVPAGEMVCPASNEFEYTRGKRLDCATCQRCNGANSGGNSVAIYKHGAGRKWSDSQKLIQIGLVA